MVFVYSSTWFLLFDASCAYAFAIRRDDSNNYVFKFPLMYEQRAVIYGIVLFLIDTSI